MGRLILVGIIRVGVFLGVFFWIREFFFLFIVGVIKVIRVCFVVFLSGIFSLLKIIL